MSLQSNALVTVEELKNFLEITDASIQTALLTIYNSSSDASAATAQITAAGITLIVTGGTNAGTSTITFAAQDTVGKIVTAINALNKGWVANIQGISSENSSSLTIKEATGCLLVGNILTLYGANNYRLEKLINSASDFIERETGRTFKSTVYTNEEYDGNGLPSMWLKQWPVISLSSISYFDQYTQTTQQTLTENTDFYLTLESGRLDTTCGVWSRSVRNIRATYTAGYATIPEDLQSLCSRLVEMRLNLRGKTGFSSVRIGQYSEAYSTSNLPPDIQSEIDKFKRVIF